MTDNPLTKLVMPGTFQTPTALLTRESPVDALETQAHKALGSGDAGTYLSLIGLAGGRRPREESLLADYARQVATDRANALAMAQQVVGQQGMAVEGEYLKDSGAGIKDITAANDPGFSQRVLGRIGTDPQRADNLGRYNRLIDTAGAMQKLGGAQDTALQGGNDISNPVNKALFELIGLGGSPATPTSVQSASVSGAQPKIQTVISPFGETQTSVTSPGGDTAGHAQRTAAARAALTDTALPAPGGGPIPGQNATVAATAANKAAKAAQQQGLQAIVKQDSQGAVVQVTDKKGNVWAHRVDQTGALSKGVPVRTVP